MKRFKVGDRFINNIDHSKVSTPDYNHQKNFEQFSDETDDSLETIGKVQTVIEIDDGEVMTDFILTTGENFWLSELGSSYALSCAKLNTKLNNSEEDKNNYHQ